MLHDFGKPDFEGRHHSDIRLCRIKAGPFPYWPGGENNNDPDQWWYLYDVVVGVRMDGSEIVERFPSFALGSIGGDSE